MVISQKVGVWTWFWYQIKAERVFLIMIPQTHFTCSLFYGSASHMLLVYFKVPKYRVDDAENLGPGFPNCDPQRHPIDSYHTTETNLEKITGCRWLDIFYIRPWVHRDALCSAMSVYLMSMHACLCTFSPSHAVTLVDFPCNRGAFGRVVSVLAFNIFCRIKSWYFAV